MVGRSIDDDDLPLEVDHPLKEFHADKELAPVDATYLESGVLHT